MALPEDFSQYMRRLIGEQEFADLCACLAEKPPVSIRLNPLKCPADAEIPLKEGCVEWCETGVYLRERPNFTFDPLLHAGLYYVQEASSMFVSQVIKQYVNRPIRMLDLCAAPGGKSTTALSVLPIGSLFYCNEPLRGRANVLSENIQKFGHTDVIVTNNFPRDYKKAGIMFDMILADVPCSGEGMFRKDIEAIKEWSLANVEHCRKLQREIISDIWSCLKPGGILIYSTCTYNIKENEDNVQWICEQLDGEIIPVNIDEEWGITNSLSGTLSAPVYRFLPHKTKGEGLFMAVIRKAEGDKISQKKRKGIKTISKIDWIKHKEEYDFVQNGAQIVAIPQAWADEYAAAISHLKVLHAGVGIGEIKGKDVIPAQSLALSTALNREKFPQIELNYAQAIMYLRKEAIALPHDTPTGFVLITYNNVPLGFGKNIGNRMNNLYPAEWKIKSTHIPEGNNEVIKIKI